METFFQFINLFFTQGNVDDVCYYTLHFMDPYDDEIHSTKFNGHTVYYPADLFEPNMIVEGIGCDVVNAFEFITIPVSFCKI